MRASGILMPISSLPSPYGIGTMGQQARQFVDFLSQAGQAYWQILPICPTSYGDSPYQSFSTYAGNPYFIDLDTLAAQGLLKPKEYKHIDWQCTPEQINYGVLYEKRYAVLRTACERLLASPPADYRDFVRKNRFWLPDYALFMALKDAHGGACWQEWEHPLRQREPDALKAARRTYAKDIAFWQAVQYLFYTQWQALKAYANDKHIQIIGDLPIYVSLDSADVWSERREFLLDKAGRPSRVAGVPPDYFSEEGQLWGNPLYDWAAQKRDGFGWWIRRVEGASRLFDAIRIDHFRAFERYWSIPAGAETAKEGQWEPGPGMDLLRVLTGWFPHITYIAEDLGLLTPEVHQLREAAGLPGMKVLEFAFSGPGNDYLPHNYGSRRCVCYTGTHDNDTALGWYDHAGEAERDFAERYLGASGRENVRQALLRCGMGSTAELFVAQMQDYLALGSEGRINVPGVAAGNWRWRMAPGAAAAGLAADIRRLTEVYGR